MSHKDSNIGSWVEDFHPFSKVETYSLDQSEVATS